MFSRRDWLRASGAGFGWLALRALAAEAAARQGDAATVGPTLKPRAKRVIFLFMHGGPSQVDTFDYKPSLLKHDGQDLPFAPAKLISATTGRKLMASPWTFKQHGESGMWASDLFPEVAKKVDQLCFIKSMHTNGQSHGQAVLKLHTGSEAQTRPSLGSWINYGLGSENENLPGFVTICPTRSHGGVQNYGNAFLPAEHQGTAIGNAEVPASAAQIKHIVNQHLPADLQRQQIDLLQAMNRRHAERVGGDDQLEGVIQSYEMAFRMQSAAPRLLDLTDETAATFKLYGINEQPTDNFGRQCLLARRFAEAGVRYIQVTHNSFKWDQHSNLKGGHQANAKEVDRPIAGLLTDLEERGLLRDTLVVWGAEFGRTPITQGKDGRDHNPQGFTVWLAGGGVKQGFSYGATDEFGYYATENKVHMHDLHATIMALLGLDHEKITYRYAGRDFRATDVYGRIVSEIFA